MANDQNYEYVSYSKSVSREEKRKGSMMQDILMHTECLTKTSAVDDLSKFVSPRYVSKSRSRLPIYYKNATNNESRADNYEMPWHSTKLEFEMTLCDTTALADSSTAHSMLPEATRYNTVCDNKSVDSETTSCNSSASSDVEIVHACCVAYKAVHDGDLDINLADRVNVIFDSPTSEFILVKHIRSGKCGYVPKICILNVNKFLNDIN